MVAGEAAAHCVAGVAIRGIHLRFMWQAWHLVTSTFVSRWHLGHWAGSGGALGLAGDAAALWMAGLALGDIYFRFAWRAWHLGHWAGSGGALGLDWLPVTLRHCVAGVAIGVIHLRFTWQAWHLVTSTFFSRGHLGHWAGSGGPLGLDWSPVTPRHFGLAGVALGDIHLRFTWQAWHLLTSTFVSRWHLGHWAGSGGVLGLDWSPVMPRHFGWQAWQAWHLVTSTFIFAWQAWHLGHWAGSGGALGPDWSPVTPRHFAWQAWHLVTTTFVSRGRRGTW